MVKTDGLKQWAVSLIVCALGGTVVSLLSPRGSMEKTLRAVIGIFVVSAVCMPLAKLKKAEAFLPAYIADVAPDIETDNLREQMVNTCKETIGRVINDVMASAGIESYEVEANVEVDDSYCIIIQDIQVAVILTNNVTAEEIQAELQKKLNVPVKVICG